MKTTKFLSKLNIKEHEIPEKIKNLSLDNLNELASFLREDILNAVSKNGGHLSSNLGVVEATVALFRVFDFTKDKIVFDVGHQCYAYKILTGRNIDRIRKKDGISGFQSIKESKYDHYQAGHSSTSIAVINSMAFARDFKKDSYDTIAFIGDGSIANGLAFEAINDAAMHKHKVIIILNDNNMAISKPVGAFGKTFKETLSSTNENPYEKLFNDFNFDYIGHIDGHNIQELTEAYKKAKANKRSIVVHIKTTKGKGYELAEKDECGYWHGVSSFNIVTGKPINEKTLTWSKVYANLLKEYMEKNNSILSIIPATSYGSEMDEVKQIYKQRTIDVGIAEGYALTLSGGLAKEGFHPVVCIYSTFLQRTYDQILHDLARLNSNITLLIDRSGLVGSDGSSHQGIFDEAFLNTIPNVVISMASTENIAKQLIEESFKGHGVFAIRYPKDSVYDCLDTRKIAFGDWVYEIKGLFKTSVVAFGPLINSLKNLLNDKETNLINAIYQTTFPDEFISFLLNQDKIIIYNPYAIDKGFANSLATHLITKGFKGKLIIKCIPQTFIEHASVNELLEELELRPLDIIKLL